ncbi:MAG: DUF2269 family protein [Gaiella sp.]|nr:DUF2269 family protein [Gaiella sp.]
MSAYQLFLFVHVAAAIAWVGAACLQVALGVRVVRAGDPSRTLAFARDAAWTGLRLYLPANLLVLVSGLLLVHEGGFGYGTLWIDVGLVGWALSVATGAAVLGPGWGAAVQTDDPEGAGAARLTHAVRRLVLVTNVDLAVLTGVVFAMAVRPTADQGAELVAGAVAVVAVLGLAARLLGGVKAATPAAGPSAAR